MKLVPGRDKSVHKIYAQAQGYHESGNLDTAASLYQEVIRRKHGHPDAMHMLGVISLQQGDTENAIRLIHAAIARSNGDANMYLHLGTALLGDGNTSGAIDAYESALSLDDTYIPAYCSLVSALSGLGHYDQATTLIYKAIKINPDVSDLYDSLGTLFRAQGKLQAAEKAYRQALQLNPDAIMPRSNLSVILIQAGLLDDAISELRRVLSLAPKHVLAMTNLGVALKKRGARDEARKCFVKCIDLDKTAADAHYNLAMLLYEDGHTGGAVRHCKFTLSRSPGHAEAHMLLSSCYLSTGNFQEGWKEYEWRWHIDGMEGNVRKFSKPRWNGANPAGKTILIHAEQGFGDSFQFIRYANMIAAQGAAVIVECQPQLTDILSTVTGVRQVIPLGSALPDFDEYVPIMSLPLAFSTASTSIPHQTPYLFPDAALVEKWAQTIRADNKLKVGICWQGRPSHKYDALRSFHVRHFSRLSDIQDIQLFGLQKYAGHEQLDETGMGLSVQDLAPVLDTGDQEFVDTAAVIQNLDLVISPDSAVAHLAGALGKPVWLLIPYVSEWRWMVDRDDSPWYPTMKIFRQQEPGNWDELFDRVKKNIQQLVNSN